MKKLQYYSDDTFGYDIWDESKKVEDGHYVVYEQFLGEDRDSFFACVGRRPALSEYGNNERLDERINCEDTPVRMAIALGGYALEKLSDDPDSEVRVALAIQGLFLDKFAHDRSKTVRQIAKNYKGGTC